MAKQWKFNEQSREIWRLGVATAAVAVAVAAGPVGGDALIRVQGWVRG